MKTLLLPVIFILAISQSPIAEAAIRTTILNVSGMTCVTCPLTIKTALKKVPGVSKVAVSYKTKQAVVTFDNAKTSVKTLRKATADVGFPSTVSK